MVSAPSKCQERCAATSWCAHFTYSVLDSVCHLADKDATRIGNALNSVAGPQNCQDQVTFALSVGGVSYQKLMSQPKLQEVFVRAVKKAVSDVAGSRADLGSGRGFGGDEPAMSTTDQEEAVSDAAGSRADLDAGEGIGGGGPLVSAADQEVVLARGPAGSLAVGVMVEPHAGEVLSSTVQHLLWRRLTHLEVKVAQYIAEADPDRTVFEGVIHVRVLTPPSALGGEGGGSGEEQGGAPVEGASWKLLRKFEGLAVRLVGGGQGHNAMPGRLVVVCFTSGFLVAALAAAAAVAAKRRRPTTRAAYASLTFSTLSELPEEEQVRGMVPGRSVNDVEECP